jgi:hypothetical protein
MKVGQQVFAQRQNPAAAQSPEPSNPPGNYAHDDIVAQPRPETSTLVKVGQVAALVSLMVGGAASRRVCWKLHRNRRCCRRWIGGCPNGRCWSWSLHAFTRFQPYEFR